MKELPEVININKIALHVDILSIMAICSMGKSFCPEEVEDLFGAFEELLLKIGHSGDMVKSSLDMFKKETIMLSKTQHQENK